MNSPKKKLPDPDLQNSPSWELPASILLSLATPPLLVGIVVGQHLTRSLTDLGKMSEEIFRGEQLPVFHFPDSQD